MSSRPTGGLSRRRRPPTLLLHANPASGVLHARALVVMDIVRLFSTNTIMGQWQSQQSNIDNNRQVLLPSGNLIFHLVVSVVWPSYCIRLNNL